MTEKKKQTSFDWLVAHTSYEGDDCLIWPFGRDDKGYGFLQAFDKIRKAHRVMAFMTLGSPPTKKHQASHSCGNGHLGCVNPKHLRWKTNSENQLERYREHGRRECNQWGQTGKLTPEQIEVIKAERGKTTIMKLAERFGVKRGAIDYWHRKARAELNAASD